ncbi:MAG: xanthine dehydrogenase small subunit [Rhodobacterales bacterium]|nr:xanthine dehydrogenase small subunit [Rhodobacterales bacterium]
MTEVSFSLNGTPVHLRDVAPTRTLLDWLREERGLTGTKEGCNEGDCGACTVMVTDARGTRALNACILFLPQLQGAAVRTVEGLAAPDGTPHPVQQALVDHHGSQCGFCTPGIVVSLAVAHAAGRQDHDDVLAGNLCRCTGYAPIVRAAQAACAAPVPDWMREAPPAVGRRIFTENSSFWQPESGDELAALYDAHPGATLVAGATDAGLWVTKGLRDLAPVIFLNRVADLQRIELQGEHLRIGAGVTIAELRAALAPRFPALDELWRRYASEQVRAAATIGGNIANGSPIGDGPPVLIALGARLHLRRGDARREIALEDFFLAYRRQDRAPGEFVEAVTIPASAPNCRAYKLSKRFDQDISAVCGAFDVRLEADGRVAAVRLAYGGMAGTPRRAPAAEAALLGQPWGLPAILAARAALAHDFTPMTDLRASAAYRLTAAGNLLIRWHHDLARLPVHVRGVQA